MAKFTRPFFCSSFCNAFCDPWRMLEANEFTNISFTLCEETLVTFHLISRTKRLNKVFTKFNAQVIRLNYLTIHEEFPKVPQVILTKVEINGSCIASVSNYIPFNKIVNAPSYRQHLGIAYGRNSTKRL